MSSDTRTPFEIAMGDTPKLKATTAVMGSITFGPANPLPHVSPAILEFRVQQLTAERDRLLVAMQDIHDNPDGARAKAASALTAWITG